MKKVLTVVGGVVVGAMAGVIVFRYTGNGWLALGAMVLAIVVAAK